ncbi:VCBS repeat-containing protein [Pseudooceanicola sp.]|uniref:FG-GAP repeat domain-containing protein n=1 Tax=Pseudooceanicola sp. TaxID=1914328 RepID=UPI002611FB88|nr:VCBS repeat-containing protein [Pseudooceanicola sp.]MDF1854785.1 VCBS repeat-containing protein [Pseudooceanicola sp.]
MPRAALALALLLGLSLSPAAARAVPTECVGPLRDAIYNTPTDRYPHGALGDPYEWAALTVFVTLTPPCRAGSAASHVVLPNTLVFEDVKPILADLTGDGVPEILTVESHRDKGARLAIYRQTGVSAARLTTTPYIGQSHRWLAQLGAADLDGDGHVEIAYIDRPHLAKVLRVWRFRDGRLEHVADLAGLTNHRFGETAISGGIRDCSGQAEIVTANASRTRLILTRLQGARLIARDAGAYSKAAEQAALACR